MRNFIITAFISMACLFASAQVIEQTYYFNNPVVKTIDGYEILNFQGCRPVGEVGAPTLPWQSVSLMLPQGLEAKAIHVEFHDFEELEGTYTLYPVQPDRPISADGPFEFEKNEDIYLSSEVYPAKANSEARTQYMNGVAFAFSGFTPMRYVAKTGKVSFAHTVVVTVETTASRTDHSSRLWLRPENVHSMEKLAQNKGMISSYHRRDGALPQYEVLVITPQSFMPYFDDYAELYAQRGLRVRTASTEDILAAMDGRDNPEKVRNYILQEYEQNGIAMVVLGGDIDLVPYRRLWCHAQEGYDDYIPSDLYYAGLDGTWNDNGNNLWGEIGEDDLLPEIGVSRLPFNSADQLETILSKTFSYMTSPVLGEFHKTTFGGEHLGNGYYASSDLERLIGEVTFNGYTTFGYEEGIFEINRVYETPTHYWNPDELRDAIRQGTQYVNHFGHANANYVAGWYNWDINAELFQGANGIDHNYTFFQSQGCICGDFEGDCILERMVLNETGILAATGNSRYGWYSTTGDASSAHLNRELVDAYYHERIPELSLAFKESKIQSAPFVTMYGESGTMRWTMYALNVLGDGTASVWFDEPFTPEIICPSQMQLGAKSIPVDVKDTDGNGLFNFRCSLFKGDELIGLANTDSNGHAEVSFYPVQQGDVLTLIVSGMSAWPQSFTITAPDSNCAYVIFDEYQINDEDGQVDFGESQTFSVTLRNVGSQAAHNVTATLSTANPEYITITQGQAQIDNMEGFSYTTLENAFTFSVCDFIPNQTEITFIIECTDGSDTWTSEFKMTAYAPVFAITNVALEEIEGNGNGIPDAGETIMLHFNIKNIGNSTAPQSHFGIYCSAPEITFEQNVFEIGDMNAGGKTIVNCTLHISESLSTATAYEMILCTYSGAYYFNDNYFVNIGCLVEDFETGDFTKYDWNMSSYHWSIASRSPYEGSYSAKSPSLNDNQSASIWMDYEVACENEMSFYYKVSSEAAYDWLNFYIDDQLMSRWAGDIDWTRAAFTLPEGQHRLKWEYAKDGGLSIGEDCAWIDFIVFPPDVTIWGIGSSVENNTCLYPNPSQGDFCMELKEKSEVTISNALGQTVLSLIDAEGDVKLHLDQKGLYFVQIHTENGTETQKFIVE